jgi:aminoglycoside 6'-N-acetyltransferase I
MVNPCVSVSQPGWLELRERLWPDATRSEHLAEMAEFLTEPGRFAQFVEYDAMGKALGFLEASIRSDYVNGTDASPVAFLEGIYVLPEARRQGVARALVAEAERWAVGAGCSEFASDALLENTLGHTAHVALGFRESERVVFFKKALR